MKNKEKILQDILQDIMEYAERVEPLRKQTKSVIRRILGKRPNAGGNFCTVIDKDLSEEILRGIAGEDQAAVDRFFEIYHRRYPTAEDWAPINESTKRFEERRAWSLAHPLQGGLVSPR